MEERRRSPMYYAAWAIAGAPLAASAFFSTLIPMPHTNPPPCPGLWERLWADRLHWIVFLILSIGGYWLWRVAEKRLKRGYVDDIWSESELDRVRGFLDEPYWLLATCVLLVVALIPLFFSSPRHSGSLFYVVTLPLTAVSSMKALLARPVPRKPGSLNVSSLPPLHSDHWGEPVKHGGNDLLPS